MQGHPAQDSLYLSCLEQDGLPRKWHWVHLGQLGLTSQLDVSRRALKWLSLVLVQLPSEACKLVSTKRNSPYRWLSGPRIPIPAKERWHGAVKNCWIIWSGCSGLQHHMQTAGGAKMVQVAGADVLEIPLES